jgi:hypothetical protein
MRPPDKQRRPGQGAAVITGNEVAAKDSARVTYVKHAILLRLIARVVPAKGAPRGALFRCGPRKRA